MEIQVNPFDPHVLVGLFQSVGNLPRQGEPVAVVFVLFRDLQVVKIWLLRFGTKEYRQPFTKGGRLDEGATDPEIGFGNFTMEAFNRGYVENMVADGEESAGAKSAGAISSRISGDLER